GVEIEHELAESTFKARQLAGQHREAGTGNPGGTLEVHVAQRFAEFIVLLERAVRARLTEAADLDVIVLVLADRNVVERNIRHNGESIIQRLIELTAGCLAALDERLQLGDLALELLGELEVLGGHCLADLLRGGVLAGLRVLQLRQVGATRLILRDQIRDNGLSSVRRLPALLQRLGQCLLVFADPFDVEHDASDSCRLPPRGYQWWVNRNQNLRKSSDG